MDAFDSDVLIYAPTLRAVRIGLRQPGLELVAVHQDDDRRALAHRAQTPLQPRCDVATARRNASAANDVLAREIAKRPERYSGFAHMAMKDAVGALIAQARRSELRFRVGAKPGDDRFQVRHFSAPAARRLLMCKNYLPQVGDIL